jgi:hypothetical protein
MLDENGDGEPDTLYIADNPNPNQAVKVWRFNYEGWGASQNGYAGPYEMGATFNDGIIADFITAGTLNAGLLKTGKIQSDSGVFIDLDNGTFGIDGSAGKTDIYADSILLYDQYGNYRTGIMQYSRDGKSGYGIFFNIGSSNNAGYIYEYDGELFFATANATTGFVEENRIGWKTMNGEKVLAAY